MATTYGYGGEFSSDEEIDRMEQQSERLAQSKIDGYAHVKPTRHQIEEAIETIRLLPLEQDVSIPDELLAGLLDHYKTQRGPIVDSTRNLYKKIILRLIRGEQQQPQPSNGDSTTTAKDSNGSNVNNNNNNNNNNILTSKKPPSMVEAYSSDEDEPMPPASSDDQFGRRKFDSRVVHADKIEPMEVDAQAPTGQIRGKKPDDDISSSEEDSETEESSESETSDSEVLDVTPIKPVGQAPKATAVVAPATKSSQSEIVVKKPVTSTPKVEVDLTKKPYTRSQRAAASRTGSSNKSDSSSNKVGTMTPGGASNSAQSTRFRVKYFVSALFIAALAFFIYYFRSDLTQSTDRIISRGIKF